MNDVRQAIRQAVQAMPTPIADPERVRRTVDRRKTRRRITAGGVAFLVAAAGLVLVVSALRSPSSMGQRASENRSSRLPLKITATVCTP